MSVVVTAVSFLILESVSLVHIGVRYFRKQKSKQASKFLLVTLTFACYNVLQIAGDSISSVGVRLYLNLTLGAVTALSIFLYCYDHLSTESLKPALHRRFFALFTGVFFLVGLGMKFLLIQNEFSFSLIPLEIIGVSLVAFLFGRFTKQSNGWVLLFSVVFLTFNLSSLLFYFRNSEVLLLIVTNLFFLGLGVVHYLDILSFFQNVLDQKDIDADSELHAVLSKYELSEREIDVAILVIQGKRLKEVASELILEYGTVTKHISNVYRKVGIEGAGKLRRFKIMFKSYNQEDKH